MMTEPGPLAGIKALEIGHGIATLLLGRLLADLGVEVVAVADGPAVVASGFEQWLRATGRPAARWADVVGLLPDADVVVCDGPGGDRLAALGLGPEEIITSFPDLITVRLSEFGMTGPLSGVPATELTLQSLAGLTAVTGEEGDPPVTSTVGLADRTAALSGLLAVAAALIGRDRGAGGDYYDIAEFDSMVTHLGTILPSVALTGAPPRRRGNRHGMAAPWNGYPCRDAHVMVCTMGEAMWHRLAAAMDRPDLATDPRFADSVARVENVDELDALVAAWTARCEASDVIAVLRAARIPCALIATPEEVRAGPAAAGRGLVSGAERTPLSPVGSLVPTPWTGEPLPRQGGLWQPVPAEAPPLQGIRVLEMGSYTAGPAAGRLLAQLGADVLKVEPPHGEGSRRLAQQIGSVGYLYFVNNAGKRSCRLDLAQPDDRARFDELADGADVLLTNLAVDTLAASGIDADQVLGRHNLVHCSVTGHGRASADRSFDTVIQAESAIMDLVGRSVGSPRRTAVSSADVLGSFLAATSVALSTYVRLRTGTGNSADVALFDAAVWATQESWFGDEHRPAPRLVQADDGVVVVDGPGEVPQAEGSVAAVINAAAAAGVPAAPLHDVTSVVRHPQVLARHMIVEQQHDDSVVLITGNHLRSLRRGAPPPALAPVNQDDPTWHPGATTTNERTTMTTSSTLDLEDILYEVNDGVATITINRARVRNALRTRTYEELTTAVTAAADDGTVGVIVITGAGDKAFSSGGDVNDQRGRTAAVGRIHLRRLLALGAAMQECGKPIIAAVRGFCVGAGHELHVMCDLTICTSDSQFGQVGPRVGSVPMWGATEMLPRIVGEKRAREMIYLTKLYSAEEAERMGLVNQVVAPDELDAAVDAMCQRLLDASPQSLRIAKTSLNFAIDSMRPAFTAGAEMLTLIYGSEEQGEGSSAFLEKRPPNYRRFRVNPEQVTGDE
jgi:dihydroxynaphthoic acid synthetase